MSHFEEGNPAVRPRADPQGEALGATLDYRAYARPIWRWKWVVLAIAILAAGGVYALTVRKPKSYTATTRVYVTEADPAAAITAGPPVGPPTAQALADIAALFTGQTITNKVYSQLGLHTLAGSVVVAPEATSSFVDVTATSRSPTLAARLANTYVSVFLASQASAVTAAANRAAAAAKATLQAIPQSGVANEGQRATLQTQIATYETEARSPSPGARVVDTAIPPTAPSSPKPIRDAAFAGVIGLLLGIGLAFILDLADRRLIRVSSVESLYGRPVVAVLPHVSAAALRVKGPFLTPLAFVEVMRSLRVNLRLAMSGRALKSVIVTSALPSEGKSSIARDLAFAYADAGERVLLIDCDLRRPSLARIFDIGPKLGLVHVLRAEASPAEAAVTVFRANAASSNGSHRHAMAAGDPRIHGSINVITHGERVDSPAALLSSKAMTGLLATAATQYDMVILDTSPILTVSDAIPLLDQVGAVLFVARLGMTTRDAAERLTELGRRVPDMNLVGVVVNDMRDSYVDEGYGYYSKYGYAYAHPEDTPIGQSAKAYGALLQSDTQASQEPASPVSYDAPTPYAPASPYEPE